MEISLYLAGLLALLVALLVGVVLQPLAKKFDIVAHPNERTVHSGNIPLIGGLAIFTGFCTAVIFVDPEFLGYQAFFLACIVLITVGLLDDRNPLSVRTRFMFQIVAVLIVAFWGDISLNNLGDILFIGDLKLGLFAIPFMVFATIGVINALNMADGVDGLASGYTVIALFGLLYLAWGSETFANEQMLLILLIAAVVGFMLLNVRSPWCRKAKVFMGDSGSMFLGFALAVAFVQLSQGDTKIMAPVTALWLFALPLMDTVSIIVRRKRQGQSPFSPGKDHIHHILQRAGYEVEQISMMGWGASVVLALIGIIGYRLGVHDGIMFSAFMTLYFFYHWMVSRALRKNQIYDQQLQPQLGTLPLSVKHPTIEYMFKPNQEIERTGNGTIINHYGMRNLSSPPTKIHENESRISVFEDSLINGGNFTDHEKLASTIFQNGLAESDSDNSIVSNVSARSGDIVNSLAYVNEYGYFGADYVSFVSDSGDLFYCPTFTGLNQKTHPTETGVSAAHEGVIGSFPGYIPSFAKAENKGAGEKEINSFKFSSTNSSVEEKSSLSSGAILLSKYHRDKIHINHVDE